jgi:hypothetical protein
MPDGCRTSYRLLLLQQGRLLSDLTDQAIEVFAEYAAKKPAVFVGRPLCHVNSFIDVKQLW